MSSLFADTHNVVAILEKSDAAEGFKQIIDFLSGSYIHYALTVNPHIYISCIKQFWNTASVKHSADVTRLQALVDKKKIVLSENVIREILQLDDAEDSSSKFYMYPRFVQLIIQNQVGDLSSHTTRFISPALTQKVFANMRRVGKGFSGVKTPLFGSMLAVRQPAEERITEEQVQTDDAVAAALEENVAEDGADFPTHIQQVLDVCSALTRRVENLKHDNAAQKLEIIKLQARVKRLKRANKGRMIDDIDKDEGIELVKDADIAETKGRHAAEQAEKQAEIYNLDMDHSSKVLISAASATISAAKPSIPAAAPTVVVAYTRRRKGILIETPKPMKKKDQIEMDAEYAKKLHKEINKDHEEFNKNTEWDATMDHNTAGYKMDFFKGMSYAEICPIFQARFDENMRFLFKSREEMEEEDQEIIKSINETPVQKAAKRRKLSEEAQETEDLKKRLEVVDDEDDDVFIEATLLARKTMFEKPDGQDAIWRNQKSVHGLELVKSWKLLTSCGVHIITLSTVQLILLVERRYPLSRFTLEQLVNVTRLQVEEESKMSLELLRFTRQQLQEYQQG
nr:hypothetical protein [Tanacetum cinerariifolium]